MTTWYVTVSSVMFVFAVQAQRAADYPSHETGLQKARQGCVGNFFKLCTRATEN